MNAFKTKIKKWILPILQTIADHFDFIVAPHSGNTYRKENIFKTSVYPSVLFLRNNPVHIGNLHKKFYANAPGITSSSEEAFVRVMNRAKVFGEAGVVIDHQNIISPDSHSQFARLNFMNNSFFFKRPVAKKKVSLLLAAHDASHNYFHWMTDAIPKLAMAQSAGYDINNIDHFIVSNYNLSFQKESLTYLKIPDEKIVSLMNENYLLCEKLIAPSSTCLSGNVSPWILEFLRKAFAEWMIIDKNLPARLFISRRNARKRILKNEQELLECLQAAGFEILYLEDLSLKEQIRYFYNAKEIIGVHGAGLTNLIFSQKGTTVIELFPITYVNQCYWTIASINNLNYGYVTGEGNDITNSSHHLIDSDFYVSVEKVMSLKRKMSNL